MDTRPPLPVTKAQRATLRARRLRDARALAERKARALSLAAESAALLRARFGATRVLLFGSLAHGHWFGWTSDVDLAAWGLGPEEHLLASAALADLGGDVPIVVLRAEAGPDWLQEALRTDGVEL